MPLLSSNVKTNILNKINEIINIEDPEWSNLEMDFKFKIIHNLCNFKKINYKNDQIFSPMTIPLKNQRPKKIIELCGINKQTNNDLFNEYKKNILIINRDFRKIYNSKTKNYCFGNLSKNNYKSILNNYNLEIYNFIYKNIVKIDWNLFYNNLVTNNQNKIINLNPKNKMGINNIFYFENLLNIEFDNNVNVELELYLTSEKITSNIPAKYKISLKNIF